MYTKCLSHEHLRRNGHCKEHPWWARTAANGRHYSHVLTTYDIACRVAENRLPAPGPHLPVVGRKGKRSRSNRIPRLAASSSGARCSRSLLYASSTTSDWRHFLRPSSPGRLARRGCPAAPPRCTWRRSRSTSSTPATRLRPRRRPPCRGCPGKALHSAMTNAAKNIDDGRPLQQWVAGYSTFLGTAQGLSMRARLTPSLLQVVGNGLSVSQSQVKVRNALLTIGIGLIVNIFGALLRVI